MEEKIYQIINFTTKEVIYQDTSIYEINDFLDWLTLEKNEEYLDNIILRTLF